MTGIGVPRGRGYYMSLIVDTDLDLDGPHDRTRGS